LAVGALELLLALLGLGTRRARDVEDRELPAATAVARLGSDVAHDRVIFFIARVSTCTPSPNKLESAG
jgi:hypothetical protein